MKMVFFGYDSCRHVMQVYVGSGQVYTIMNWRAVDEEPFVLLPP